MLENVSSFVSVFCQSGDLDEATADADRDLAAVADRGGRGGPRREQLLHRSIGQSLEGSFSAVSRPNFATEYAFE